MERQDYMMWVFQLKKIQSSATNLQERGQHRFGLCESQQQERKSRTSDRTHPDTGIQQGTLHFVDLSPPPLVTEECRSLNTRQCGIHKYKGECSGVLSEEGARAVLTPAKENVRQNGRRMKEPEEPMFTITATDRHGILYHGRIRRLVPRECLRLQGYYDWQIDKIIDSTSDAQLYKQAGNGVTVNVIEAIGRLLQKADSELNTQKVSEKGIH